MDTNDGLPPPRGVAPDVLWRRLLPLRPEQTLDFRLAAWPKQPLVVRAVPSFVFARAFDEAGLERDDTSFAVRTIMAAVLFTKGKRAFASAHEIGTLLRAEECGALSQAVLAAVHAICPTFGRIDLRAWRKVLTDGAKKDAGRASTLAACSTPIVIGKKVLWNGHPERYWGIAPCDLLDGHRLAFEAAMTAMGKTE